MAHRLALPTHWNLIYILNGCAWNDGMVFCKLFHRCTSIGVINRALVLLHQSSYQKAYAILKNNCCSLEHDMSGRCPKPRVDWHWERQAESQPLSTGQGCVPHSTERCTEDQERQKRTLTPDWLESTWSRDIIFQRVAITELSVCSAIAQGASPKVSDLWAKLPTGAPATATDITNTTTYNSET